MKFSQFNLSSYYGGELILYNSMTGALAIFDEQRAANVARALALGDVGLLPDNFFDDMKADGFIVPIDVDELASINDLVQRRIHWRDSWHVSIMINRACNFRCFYCFQAKDNIYMSTEIRERVLLMLRKVILGTKSFSIDWYGGEPLLSLDTIMEMNEQVKAFCAAHGVAYEISVTTNGYLLTEKAVNYFTTCNVSHFQITLDAPESYHDRARILRDGRPTFADILSNIKRAVANKMYVVVRVNVTHENSDSCFEIYQILENAGLKNKVEVSIRPVVSSTANPCEEKCLGSVEFGLKMMRHYYQAALNSWVVIPGVDHLQSMEYCVADYPTQAIVDPRGNVYKCGETFGEEERVGKIDESGEIVWNSEKFDRFVRRNPLDFPECRQCKILPICMGGCHMMRFWKKEISCNEFRHDLDLFVKTLYLNQINMEKCGDQLIGYK